MSVMSPHVSGRIRTSSAARICDSFPHLFIEDYFDDQDADENKWLL